MKFNLLASASSIAMCGLVFGAGIEPAHATLNCTATSCSETIYAATTKTDFTGVTANVDFFDPSAGETLQSVVITEGASFNASGSLTNTSNSSENFKFTAGLALSLYGGVGAPSVFPVSPSAPLLFAKGAVATKSYNLASDTSTPYNFTAVFTSASTTINSRTTVAEFIGSSTFQVVFDSDATTDFTGGGNNIRTNLTTVATPEIQITYNFTTTAVPEPASVAILGAGLAGIGVMRRRKKV